MATLVLTAVGTAVGGPIGGALGGLIGGAIDTQLFGQGPRRGPRLDDLKLQTSAYGTQIPRLYGRMRVAGTVVWATDLEEHEELEGGGKGSPESVQYSYSCSFAVALSSRPIEDIGRIWADGKLIRGRRGDLKVKGKLRVHRGTEGQGVDPLIASSEGTAKTPAYRGLALAVFEDLALVEFGNRIPMLTFEIVADGEPLGAEEVIADAVGAPVVTAPVERRDLVGFAAMGSDRRTAVEGLADLASVPLMGELSSLGVGARPVRAIGADEAMGWSADAKRLPNRGEWSQDGVGTAPASLSIRYHEPDRDYQAGTAMAVMADGRGNMLFDSAAALLAGDARRWAERAMARRWAGRDRLTLRLSPDWMDLVPGERLDLGWRSGRWTVDRVTVEAFAVIAECRREAGAGTAVVADPGRAVIEEDVPIGETVIQLFDLPDLGMTGGTSPVLHAAVSAARGFKAVPLSTTVGTVTGPTAIAARRAKLGRANTPLGVGSATVVDRLSTVEVELIDPAQVVLNADEDALDAGANLCVVGDELLQFARAEDLGDGRYRLSGLMRGRRGTEWAMATHAVGEPFAMIDPSALVPLALDAAWLGQDVSVRTHGVADDPGSPPTATRPMLGEAMRPVAPCRLRMAHGGTPRIEWTRRAKSQWTWGDATPADPEVAAMFEVVLAGSSGTEVRTVVGESVTLDAAGLATIGIGLVDVSVREIGGMHFSRPLIGQVQI